MCEGSVVHRHQHLEDLEVLLGVAGGREQGAEDAGAHEDERLTPFPVAAERGQRLAGVGLALALRFDRDLLRREGDLDQRGLVLPGEGLDLGPMAAHSQRARAGGLEHRALDSSPGGRPIANRARAAFTRADGLTRA